LSENLLVIVLVLAGLCLVGILLAQQFQLTRLKSRIDALTGGVEGDLEAVLTEHIETVHAVARDLDELTARTAVMEAAARHHFSKQGLVRFSPFQDTGGDQSFALALLDESDNGIVMSSLHSRTGTRIYAKAVSAGKTSASLSDEETQAIEEARTKRNPAELTSTRATRAKSVESDLDSEPVAAPVKATPKVVAATRMARQTTVEPTDDVSDRSFSRGKHQGKDEVEAGESAESESESERVGRKPGRH
jgi:hypothetical protein